MRARFFTFMAVLFAGYCATAQTTDKKATQVESAQQKNLESLKGNYVSKDNPDGMLLYVQGDKLMGKILGQPSIAFEPAGTNMYRSEKADMLIKYVAEKKQVVVTQKGKTQTLTLQ